MRQRSRGREGDEYVTDQESAVGLALCKLLGQKLNQVRGSLLHLCTVVASDWV